MLAAGMFVADKADAGQAGTVAEDITEGLVRVLEYSLTIPPPVHFVLESSTADIFKGGDNTVVRFQKIWIMELEWTIDYGQCDRHQGIFSKQFLNCYFGALLLGWAVQSSLGRHDSPSWRHRGRIKRADFWFQVSWSLRLMKARPVTVTCSEQSLKWTCSWFWKSSRSGINLLLG